MDGQPIRTETVLQMKVFLDFFFLVSVSVYRDEERTVAAMMRI